MREYLELSQNGGFWYMTSDGVLESEAPGDTLVQILSVLALSGWEWAFNRHDSVYLRRKLFSNWGVLDGNPLANDIAE